MSLMTTSARVSGHKVSAAALIAANRTQFGVPHALSCRLLGVSESWLTRDVIAHQRWKTAAHSDGSWVGHKGRRHGSVVHCWPAR